MRRRCGTPPTALVSAAPLAAALCTTALTGCGQDDPAASAEEPLQVFAAASLSDTFTEIGELFEQQHGTPVTFNFAGSSDLVAQIEQGAPADVFASADQASMERAEQADVLSGEPAVFASNTLVIATGPDDPAQLEELSDLADDDVVTVVCAPQVPCGAAAQEAAEAADVELSPASEEMAVTDVLGKVRAGEADAGLVYRTDVVGAGDDVLGIEFPESDQAVNLYPIAGLSSDGESAGADQFIEFVNGAQAAEIFDEAGFEQP